MASELPGLPSERPSTVDISTDTSILTRRLRHISSIQVRNVTPFPVRDAFTSALSQPVDLMHSASTVNDDLHVLSSRRRSRKISSNSVATRSSLKWEDGLHDEETTSLTGGSGTLRGRKTSTGSRVNFASTGADVAGTSLSPKTTSFVKQRPRTNSKASSTTSSRIHASYISSNAAARTSSFLPDHSQKGLEKVINSRLLETCLVLSVMEYPPEAPLPTAQRTAGLVSPTQADFSGKPTPKSAPPLKSQFKAAPHARQSSSSSISKRIRTHSSDSTSSDIKDSSDPKMSRTPSSSMNGKVKVFPSPQPKARPKLSNLIESFIPRKPDPLSLTYRSPIHRPSTNPSFPLGPSLVSQSLEWTRLNAQSLKVAIWGKLPQEVQRSGWDDTHQPPYPDESGYRWCIIQEWDVQLDELVPLSDDVHSCDLPSNTFLLTLGPHGRTYYTPHQTQLISRPSTPSTGYASDPESELHKVKRTGDGSSFAPDAHSRRRRRGANMGDSKDIPKTATWPDLFQLATLQALIYDNDASLSTISAKVDRLIAEDIVSPLNREISERQYRISEHRSNREEVLNICSQRRETIESRRELFRKRRENLSVARQAIGEAEEAEADAADRVDEERSQLASLRLTMTAMRSHLVAILSDIFPIELYSPADLLFTIFDVALPLPLAAKDPAPPLSVPEHKDINEDSVATALGYVAQVLQILAAYLGTSLLYPVTCIGSRSLIRDNISAMIGPRMFPLYSKGVDTYRFEYGVFLLNKNIEILMVEKDLRALDMRHTLPNLKNLLLILSHEHSRSELPKSKLPPSSSSLSLLSLDSESTQDMERVEGGAGDTTKGRRQSETDGSGELNTPLSGSGSTTPIPTPASDESRKSRFLALAPFTGFLRGRYPSTSRASTQSVQESAEGGGEEDEEDRSTIHGLVRDVDVGESDNHDSEVAFKAVENDQEPKPQHSLAVTETLSPETG